MMREVQAALEYKPTPDEVLQAQISRTFTDFKLAPHPSLYKKGGELTPSSSPPLPSSSPAIHSGGGGEATTSILSHHTLPVEEWGADEVISWCVEKKLRLSKDTIFDENIDGETLLAITDVELQELEIAKSLQRRRILTEISKLKPSTTTLPPPPPPPVEISKFIGTKMRVGKAEEAAGGLAPLLGVSSAIIGGYISNPMDAIRHEIQSNGSASDKLNLNKVLSGSFKFKGESLTIETLLKHGSAVTAKLEYHHVLVLRLYTTQFFDSINAPLRAEPIARPHPFAATVYFITQAINLLRQVDGKKPDKNEPRIYWRGCKDLAVSGNFLSDGGTEIACMSASTVREVAVGFAKSKCPLVFRLETDNFMSRGADVSFLSVFPNEKEVLYPPLTYLQATKSVEEMVGDTVSHIIYVKPTLGTV
jgi:hypothetical protein